MAVLHMFFETRPEILSTLEAHYNRCNQQQHGECTEDSQHASCWFIRCCRLAYKDLAEFVHEISDCNEVRHDNKDLAFATLMLHNPCREYEQCCCKGNSTDRQIELCVPHWQSLGTGGHCEELYREAKEEEKVKFQECNVELYWQLSVSLPAPPEL